MNTSTDKNRTLALVDRIGETIMEEQLVAGRPFMTEQQVADRFNTSRRVAREAVAHLRTLGVLEARQRKGLTVSKPNPTDLFSQTLHFFAQTPEDLAELAKLRYVLETGALEFAVASNEEEHIRIMHDAAQTYASQVLMGKKKWDEVVIYQCEYDFHRSILMASGSPLLSGLHGVLIDYFHAERRFKPLMDTDATRQLMESAAWEHKAIVEAFKDRDVERARALLRHHLRYQKDFRP